MVNSRSKLIIGFVCVWACLSACTYVSKTFLILFVCVHVHLCLRNYSSSSACVYCGVCAVNKHRQVQPENTHMEDRGGVRSPLCHCQPDLVAGSLPESGGCAFSSIPSAWLAASTHKPHPSCSWWWDLNSSPHTSTVWALDQWDIFPAPHKAKYCYKDR